MARALIIPLSRPSALPAQLVIKTLSADTLQGLPVKAFAWDYEHELASSAVGTLTIANDARVVEALSQIRERLLTSETTELHGDVHPGNVILRAGRPTVRVVLIDWARARIGSPMEDVPRGYMHSVAGEPLHLLTVEF